MNGDLVEICPLVNQEFCELKPWPMKISLIYLLRIFNLRMVIFHNKLLVYQRVAHLGVFSQWIGLWENLKETIDSCINSGGVLQDFP